MKVSATSAVDLVFSLLIISTLVSFGLRVNLRHVVRGQVAVDVKVGCTGVVFIHTQELIDQLLVTGEALI